MKCKILKIYASRCYFVMSLNLSLLFPDRKQVTVTGLVKARLVCAPPAKRVANCTDWLLQSCVR